MALRFTRASPLLESAYASVLARRDVGELRERVIVFAHDLGFDRVGAVLAQEEPDGSTRFECVHNAPPRFVPIFEDGAEGRVDPVMQHCKRSGLPIVWDQATYLRAGCIEKWETQAPFGYRCGVAVVLHLPAGRHYMVGVDRDQPIDADPSELTRVVAALQLFTVHAYEAASAVYRTSRLTIDPKLTKRELEAVRWTAAGNTASQVGARMGITGRTAAVHLMRATRKLRCANKLQAAVQAARMGLIEL